jgi:hypothetical protein
MSNQEEINRDVFNYDQYRPDLRKNLFIFIYLTNMSSSCNLHLGLNIKQDELEHNKVFINKLVRLNLSI